MNSNKISHFDSIETLLNQHGLSERPVVQNDSAPLIRSIHHQFGIHPATAELYTDFIRIMPECDLAVRIVTEDGLQTTSLYSVNEHFKLKIVKQQDEYRTARLYELQPHEELNLQRLCYQDNGQMITTAAHPLRQIVLSSGASRSLRH